MSYKEILKEIVKETFINTEMSALDLVVKLEKKGLIKKLFTKKEIKEIENNQQTLARWIDYTNIWNEQP